MTACSAVILLQFDSRKDGKKMNRKMGMNAFSAPADFTEKQICRVDI